MFKLPKKSQTFVYKGIFTQKKKSEYGESLSSFGRQSMKQSHLISYLLEKAGLIYFFARQVRRLFEDGAYLNIVPDKFTFAVFLFNDIIASGVRRLLEGGAH